MNLNAQSLTTDKQETRLASPEGEPKLERVMGPFASFAISMSTICILSGGIASFHVGLCSVGGAAIGLGWPLASLFSLTVALTMGQVASAFPRAGGPYQWAAILGGRGWGWAAACFGMAGLITALAAVNVGTCRFLVSALSRELQYEPENVHPWIQMAAALLMTASQAFINHRGIRLTSWLMDMSGYLIIGVAILLTGLMLLFGMILGPGFDFARLVTFDNFSGEAGRKIWPATTNIAWLFVLGMLLPAYTISGFDAAAQTAEETVNPRRNVPRGIVRSVLVSGIAGWVMLSAIVLAAPTVPLAASKGTQSFFYIVRTATPYWTHALLYTGIIAAMYLCGLATLTSVSRMTFALARDGGTPFARALSRIGTHHTPSVAIWTVAGVAALFIVAISYEAIAAVCAIFLYLAYVLPTVMGLLTYRRWSYLAEWHIGRWYRPLAVACILGCVALIIIGMQPPNDIAVWVVGIMIAALLALWFGYLHHHFPGPPADVLHQLRPMEATTAPKVDQQGAP